MGTIADLSGTNLDGANLCFHSINVPSEWEPRKQSRYEIIPVDVTVSIQLMSPASGNR